MTPLTRIKKELFVWKPSWISCALLIICLNSYALQKTTKPQSRSPKPIAEKTPRPSKKKSITILVLGDSLTAGYGLPKKNSYPSLLQQQLNKKWKVFHIKIINAGITGSTTSSALPRLKKGLKKHAPIDFLILALGGNDGLRGTPIAAVQRNLQQTIDLALSNKIQVLLAGMKIPPNYGAQYTKEFEKIFRTLAQKNKITLIPFLLKDVAVQPHLNLPDGIHPNAQGHQIISQTVLPFLERMIHDQS